MSKTAIFLVLTLVLRGCGIPMEATLPETTTTVQMQEAAVSETEQMVVLS